MQLLAKWIKPITPDDEVCTLYNLHYKIPCKTLSIIYFGSPSSYSELTISIAFTCLIPMLYGSEQGSREREKRPETRGQSRKSLGRMWDRCNQM